MQLLKKVNGKSFLVDLICIIVLTFISLSLIFFYISGEVLQTGYPDWLVHAFRVKQLQLYGLSSWDHTWSNGVSIWRSYQFFPHYITLYFSEIFNVSIPRAMVLLTIIQFILLRLFIYISLRVLRIPAIPAFLCTLISFDIPHYWKAVGDYSLMFGITLFPLLLLTWIYYLKGRITYLFPYVSGLLFYIHPLLGLYAFFLLITGLFFSSRRVISISALMQFLVFAISSSLFWIPILHKQTFTYTNDLFSSKDFYIMAINPYGYFGLSLYIFIAIVVTLIFLFYTKVKKDKWVLPLFLTALSILALIIIGTQYELPKLISQTQFVRGIMFIGIMFIFSLAPILAYLFQLRWTVVKILIAVFIALMFVESINYTSSYAPPPTTSKQDPVAKFFNIHKEIKGTKKTWTPLIDVSSFYGSSDTYYGNSYNQHLDSNQVGARLNQIMGHQTLADRIPQSSLIRLENYIKLTGMEYLFFEENSPFTPTLSKSTNFTNFGRIETSTGILHAFDYNKSIINSAAIDTSLAKKLKGFPLSLNVDKIEDQISFDQKVEEFSKVITHKNNIPLRVEYPRSDSLIITIPKENKSNLIYVNESFDTGWSAYINNTKQKITPVGPGYMLITLTGSPEGTLILSHRWPFYSWISWFLIILLPAIILSNNYKDILFNKNK